MPILEASGGPSLRPKIIEYLRKRKAENPAFSVIDIGGTGNPWCDELVDAYIDVRWDPPAGKTLFKGDVNLPHVWEQIKERRWDFAICTHTLEDIRSPEFVIRQLQECAREGFVSVPNKHTELSHVESIYWVGYCHHRWIFTVQEGSGGKVLRAMAKYPILNYFSPRHRLVQWLGRSPLLSRALTRFRRAPATPALSWLDPSLVRPQGKFAHELGVHWRDDLPFEFVNGDYAGDSLKDLADLCRDLLGKGL